MFGTGGLMGNNNNFYAHQMPIAANAYHSQHQRFPSGGHYGQVAPTTTATPFYGNGNPNFGNAIVQRQPTDFLRNSMDSVFMSPQEESKQSGGHFDYRQFKLFGILSYFLNSGPSWTLAPLFSTTHWTEMAAHCRTAWPSWTTSVSKSWCQKGPWRGPSWKEVGKFI